jgi:hypothetical protein
MTESRIEIDTAAPFASVKDALNIFGEGSSTRVQRNFTIGPSPDQVLLLVQAVLLLSSKHAVFSNVCKEQNYTIWVIVSSMSLTNCFYTVITHQLSSAISGYEVIALPGDATPSNIMCISLVLSTFFEDEIQ